MNGTKICDCKDEISDLKSTITIYEEKIRDLEEMVVEMNDENEMHRKSIEELKKQTPKKLSDFNNTKQKRQSEYLDKMPENIIQIDKYGGLEFDRYFFDIDNERIIMITSNGKIKVVNGKTVTFSSVNGEMKSILYSKLLKHLKSLNN